MGLLQKKSSCGSEIKNSFGVSFVGRKSRRDFDFLLFVWWVVVVVVHFCFWLLRKRLRMRTALTSAVDFYCSSVLSSVYSDYLVFFVFDSVVVVVVVVVVVFVFVLDFIRITFK